MSTVDVAERSQGSSNRAAIRWPLHIAFVVALIAFVALYFRTIISLIWVWAGTGRYQYAFLIFPVSAVLIWQRRRSLIGIAAGPNIIGLAILCALCLLWLAGAAAQVNLVTQFVVVALVPCLVFAFYGSMVVRALMFPLGYLIFAIPVGNFLVAPLQTVTARLSVAALQWTPVPVFLDGHLIMTPSSTWHVAEACSGVGFFFATTAFGVLYAYLFFRRWRRRVAFVALALVAPIIANGLRVFFTILIGEYLGMQYATGTDHMVFGWQFFGTVMVLVFLIGWPWHEPAATVVIPANGGQSNASRQGRSRLLGTTIIALALLAAPPIWMAANSSSSASVVVQSATLPDFLAGLSSTGGIITSSAAPGTRFGNADSVLHMRYGAAQSPVNAMLAKYKGSLTSGNEMVAYGNRLFDGTIWEVVDSRVAPIGIFHELRLARRGGHGDWLFWYFYRVGSRTVTSTVAVKFWQAWNRMLGGIAPTEVVTLATPISDSKKTASQRLKTAATDLLDSWNQQDAGQVD